MDTQEMESLHDAILNIIYVLPHGWDNPGTREVYVKGHYDARHAAAELVSDHKSETKYSTQPTANADSLAPLPTPHIRLLCDGETEYRPLFTSDQMHSFAKDYAISIMRSNNSTDEGN